MSKFVVYILHGTWPFGFFRRKSDPKRPAWFEPGGAFYNVVLETLPKGTVIRCFYWSGRNGFAARSSAAHGLAQYILRAGETDPIDTAYAIVAHSHGGTVAAEAMSMISEKPVAQRVTTLITLATPFASSSPAVSTNRIIFAAAVGAFWAAMAALMGLWVAQDWLIAHRVWLGLLPLFALAVILLHPVMHSITGAEATDYLKGAGLPKNFPIVILRAPQDEASLVLSFVQALRNAARAIYTLADLSWSAGSIARIIIGGVLIVLLQSCLRWFFFNVAEFRAEAADILAIFLATGIPAFVLLLSEFLSALSVGHWRPWLWWARSIDVETAPLNHFACSIIVLSNGADDNLSGMRHSLHERADARDFVHTYLRSLVVKHVKGVGGESL